MIDATIQAHKRGILAPPAELRQTYGIEEGHVSGLILPQQPECFLGYRAHLHALSVAILDSRLIHPVVPVPK